MDLCADEKEEEILIEYQKLLEFIEKSLKNVEDVETNENNSGRRKRLNDYGSCSSCHKRKYKKTSLLTCTGEIKCCHDCEYTHKLNNNEIDCSICLKTVVCNCVAQRFTGLTCKTHCCWCIKLTDPWKIKDQYRYCKATPSNIIALDIVSPKDDPSNECAKRYTCLSCSNSFIVQNDTEDIYFLLQRWFCKDKSCQEKCSKYFKHQP